MLTGELNERSRLTMKLASPGTAKCHPSWPGGTKPAQLPVGLKFAAVIGVEIFGSSCIWYVFALDAADPVPAVTTTRAPTAATTPASRHPVKRAVLVNTGSLLLGTRHPCGPHFIGKCRGKCSMGTYYRIKEIFHCY